MSNTETTAFVRLTRDPRYVGDPGCDWHAAADSVEDVEFVAIYAATEAGATVSLAAASQFLCRCRGIGGWRGLAPAHVHPIRVEYSVCCALQQTLYQLLLVAESAYWIGVGDERETDAIDGAVHALRYALALSSEPRPWRVWMGAAAVEYHYVVATSVTDAVLAAVRSYGRAGGAAVDIEVHCYESEESDTRSVLLGAP